MTALQRYKGVSVKWPSNVKDTGRVNMQAMQVHVMFVRYLQPCAPLLRRLLEVMLHGKSSAKLNALVQEPVWEVALHL